MPKTLRTCKVGNVITPPILSTYRCTSARDFHERVKDTDSHPESSRSGLSPIPEPEAKSTKVVHELSSPPTQGPSPKRLKGKKESSRKMLKEYLNNLEDEMICPMSGSDPAF